jgi:preprotein translocase subunit SecG
MTILFVILIILASALLGFIVLVQNPKGGGLASSIGGFNNQFMGVKQTNDVLEKGTWILAAAVVLLCVFSAAFIPRENAAGPNLLEKVNTKPTTTNNFPANPPANTPAPAPAGR